MWKSSNNAENCPRIELTGHTLEGNYYYLGNIIEARGGVFNSAKTRIRSGWCEFRDCYIKSEAWPVKEEDVIRLERDDGL